MKTKDWHYWSLVAVSIGTILSGLLQMLAPGLVLRFLSAQVTPAGKQLFGTIGMFMSILGGAFLHALLSSANHPVVILWGSLQKFGACVAVAIGVKNAIFSPVALLVAGFDLLSGILGMRYWRRLLD